MEFWGVEVKAGEPLKVQPDYGRLIHISQASLGEVKDVKGSKNVSLRLKIGDKSFIIGSLSAEDRTQLMFDFVFEKEFELSHDWKNGSVYFIGYIADNSFSDDEYSTHSSDDSEDELVENLENGEIKLTAGDGKAAAAAAAAKAPKGAAKAATKKEESSDSDDDDEDSEDDSDDDMALDGPLEGDSSDDLSGEDSEDDDSSEEELPNPKQLKKRPAGSAQEAPVAAKKAKSSTPDKKGDKKGQNATPFPLKAAAGKTPPGDKSKESPKSGGQFSRKSGNKSLNSKNGKGKRGGK